MGNPTTELHIRRLLAFNIRRYRASLGVSQEQLGELTGLHRTYISNVERAQLNVTLESLDALARALGVGAHQLLEPDSHVPEAE